jgi:hypothetical protein
MRSRELPAGSTQSAWIMATTSICMGAIQLTLHWPIWGGVWLLIGVAWIVDAIARTKDKKLPRAVVSSALLAVLAAWCLLGHLLFHWRW